MPSGRVSIRLGGPTGGCIALVQTFSMIWDAVNQPFPPPDGDDARDGHLSDRVVPANGESGAVGEVARRLVVALPSNLVNRLEITASKTRVVSQEGKLIGEIP
jgi:hypothetical protein